MKTVEDEFCCQEGQSVTILYDEKVPQHSFIKECCGTQKGVEELSGLCNKFVCDISSSICDYNTEYTRFYQGAENLA
ncbi:hypothetical protein [Ruminococcus sp.]|uniref:hypothetical protein n=1 Tax=Ruminococcus sp. TaxID=41978 RepID=UPI0025FD3D46|nr:hypothetical protein [Ruminococcus sp.]